MQYWGELCQSWPVLQMVRDTEQDLVGNLMVLSVGPIVFRVQEMGKEGDLRRKGQVAPAQVCFSVVIVLSKWQVSFYRCGRLRAGGDPWTDSLCPPPREALCRFRESIEWTVLNLRAQDLEFGKQWRLKVPAGMVAVARWGVSSF